MGWELIRVARGIEKELRNSRRGILRWQWVKRNGRTGQRISKINDLTIAKDRRIRLSCWCQEKEMNEKLY